METQGTDLGTEVTKHSIDGLLEVAQLARDNALCVSRRIQRSSRETADLVADVGLSRQPLEAARPIIGARRRASQ